MILKIKQSYVNVLNPSLYFLSFKVKNVCCGQGFVLFLTIYGKVYS